ncbi:NADH-ubiquinone oxidoreductase [Paramyrothecium foliicola]|nr:NADH-ubiquinone oxidoreductase [Paramyrothecium foliicola]
MFAARQRACGAARQLQRSARTYASDAHGHHKAPPVNESFSTGSLITVGAFFGSVLLYQFVPKDGQDSAFMNLLNKYQSKAADWEELNALHAKTLQQASFDRNLFENASNKHRFVDVAYPEAFTSHAPRNIQAGQLINLDHVVEHYRQQHVKEEDRAAPMLSLLRIKYTLCWAELLHWQEHPSIFQVVQINPIAQAMPFIMNFMKNTISLPAAREFGASRLFNIPVANLSHDWTTMVSMTSTSTANSPSLSTTARSESDVSEDGGERSQNWDAVEMQPSGGGRGLGIFAKEHFPSRHRIIYEAPIMTCVHRQQPPFESTAAEEWNHYEDQHRAVLSQVFRPLKDIPSGANFTDSHKKKLRKFILQYAFSGPTVGQALVYTLASHFNHACVRCANAELWIDPIHPYYISVRLMKEIAKGQEIFICYNRRKLKFNCAVCGSKTFRQHYRVVMEFLNRAKTRRLGKRNQPANEQDSSIASGRQIP